MFGVLTRLLAALGRLAASFEATAETMEQANLGLRQRLALDGPREEPAALPAPEEEPVSPSRRNGAKAKGGVS
jgi:hypothetical protein